MKNPVGILLVNLGTPDSPKPRDVYRYLIEFLTDERVIDFSWLKRQLLVRGLIVPFRYRQSSACYKKIWTEQGSPLMVYGRSVEKLLQQELGENYRVVLAMRYRRPSIEEGLQTLVKQQVGEIVVIPLFPQYASATTGSVHQKIMECVQKNHTIPKFTFINNFATHPDFITAFQAVGSQIDLKKYDHILFSYHSLPQRQLKKAQPHMCLQSKDCCSKASMGNNPCYSAQCYATTRALVERLGLASGQYSVSFQSRLGKDPWLQPYTSDTIATLARKGIKRIAVFCPSFVCDCLETIYEIGIEYAAEFKHAGGESLDLIPSLNDHPQWISALKTFVKER